MSSASASAHQDDSYPRVQVVVERHHANGRADVRVLHCPFCSNTHTHNVAAGVDRDWRVSHCAEGNGQTYELML